MSSVLDRCITWRQLLCCQQNQQPASKLSYHSLDRFPWSAFHGFLYVLRYFVIVYSEYSFRGG